MKPITITEPAIPFNARIPLGKLSMEDFRYGNRIWAYSNCVTSRSGHTVHYVDSALNQLTRIFPFLPAPEPSPAPEPPARRKKPGRKRKGSGHEKK